MGIKINIGDLNHKIAINYNAQPERSDTNGVPWPDWQPLTPKPLYTKKEPLSLSRLGRYFFQNSAEQNESEVVYTTHYREDIKAGMQIIDKTEVLEIKVPPADPDGKRRWILIHARSLVQNGG